MGVIINIKNLSVFFNKNNHSVCSLKEASLTLSKNKTTAIVGESGSGKTITALAIMGLLPNQANVEGEIIYHQLKQDINIASLSKKEISLIRGKKIAMIFQEPMTALNPLFTCGQQLIDVLRQHLKITKSAAKKKAIALFEKVELPSPFQIFDKYPHQLSGGQRQRVMIAMAISCNPDLLIADEPTTALDAKVQQGIMNLLKTLQQENSMSILLITHDLGLVRTFADDIAIMNKGHIVEYNNTRSIFENPQHDYTKSLLNCRLTITGKKQALIESNDEFNSIKAFNSNSSLKERIPALTVNNLSVIFEPKQNFWRRKKELTPTLDNISFQVFQNEILGIVGESGSGKSTIAKCIVQLIKPNYGEILFNNNLDVKTSQNNHNIQIVFQDPYSSLNPKLTVGEAIIEAMKINNFGKNNQIRKEKTEELLEMVGLSKADLDKYPHQFSGGQRQRICIARSLAVEPSFLIFDESISALDAFIQVQILKLIQQLKSTFNFSAIFISHDLPAVHFISDRILVLEKGKIVEINTADEILLNPQKNYTKSLVNASLGELNLQQ